VRRTTGKFEAGTEHSGVNDVRCLPAGAGGDGEPVRPRGAARGAETAWDVDEKQMRADERVMDEPSRPLLLQKRHETRYKTLVTASWCGSSPYCAAWTGWQTDLAAGLNLSGTTTGSRRGPISRRSGVVGSTPTIGAGAALPAAGDAEADADAPSFPAEDAALGISTLPAARKQLVMGSAGARDADGVGDSTEGRREGETPAGMTKEGRRNSWVGCLRPTECWGTQQDVRTSLKAGPPADRRHF
jgi:hypothetical protein